MLTQGELAELADLSLYTVHAAEHGRNVSPKTGRALATALGVEPAELLPKEPAPPSLEPSFNDVLREDEERRLAEGWAEDIRALAASLEAADTLWEKKLADDVYDRAEVETARSVWNLQWESYGNRLTEERTRGKKGKATLPDSVHSAYADALQWFGILSQTLSRAEENPRFQVTEEPADLRQRRSSEAG